MIRIVGAVLCAAILSGCSSGGGTNPIVSAIWQKVRPGQRAEAAAEAADSASRTPIVLTFAKIQETGLAIIRARVGDDTHGVLLYARALNDGYVTYASQLHQTITMRGSLMTATRAIGHDLLAVRSDPNDPVAVKTKPESWPDHVSRDYRLPGDGPGGLVISVRCQFVQGPDYELELLDAVIDTQIIMGNCSGGDTSFTNVHLVAPDGRIWRSAQWIGPGLGVIEIDILEPFTAD